MRRTWLVAVAVTVTVTLPASVGAQILPREPINTSPTIYAGVPPTGFRVESSTPASVSFTWAATVNATGYTILRSTGAGQPWTTVTPTPLPAGAVNFSDQTGVDFRIAYIYRLQANYSGTPPGYVDLPVTLPQPLNPTGFTAKQTGEGAAELSWQPVPNASYYWIWGPGTGTEGVRADGTTKTFSGIGTGLKEWSITTRYDPAGVLLPAGTWPKTQLNMVTRTGMYRITLNGFEVVAAADDDRIGADGWGNEIISVNYVRVFDRASGSLLKEGPVESAVHGDTEGFQGRVPAGSARATGGLVTGNKFPGNTPWMRNNSVSPTTFPLLLWEGSLTNGGEAVVITPMLFEWESPDRANLDATVNKLRELTAGLWPVIAPAAAGAPTAGPVLMDLNRFIPWGPVSDRTIWGWTHVIGGTETHPVEKNSYTAKHVGVVITREMIEAALTGQQIGAYGPGIVQVRWIDKGLKANYLLFLQVARQ